MARRWEVEPFYVWWDEMLSPRPTPPAPAPEPQPEPAPEPIPEAPRQERPRWTKKDLRHLDVMKNLAVQFNRGRGRRRQ